MECHYEELETPRAGKALVCFDNYVEPWINVLHSETGHLTNLIQLPSISITGYHADILIPLLGNMCVHVIHYCYQLNSCKNKCICICLMSTTCLSGTETGQNNTSQTARRVVLKTIATRATNPIVCKELELRAFFS